MAFLVVVFLVVAFLLLYSSVISTIGRDLCNLHSPKISQYLLDDDSNVTVASIRFLVMTTVVLFQSYTYRIPVCLQAFCLG